MRPASLVVALVAVVGHGLVARAQSDDERFRPIEEGFDDVSPHAESNRLQPIDTRIPLDFTRVYEIVDAPGLLARRSGALTAVFPRSIYNADASAPIPPGTVFYVGELPVNLAQPGMFAPQVPVVRSPSMAWNRVEGAAVRPAQQAPMVGQRIDLRVPVESPVPSAAPLVASPGEATIWASEAYRQQRVGDILRGVVWRAREAATVAERERTEEHTNSDAAAGQEQAAPGDAPAPIRPGS